VRTHHGNDSMWLGELEHHDSRWFRALLPESAMRGDRTGGDARDQATSSLHSISLFGAFSRT